jgi:hypothetical protein
MPRLTRPDRTSVWGPDREWWVFNPGPRLDICIAEGVYDYVFHQKTYQFKPNMRISPQKHLTMLGQNYPWRAMLVDYHEAVVLLYTAERGWDGPAGVFPMWSATRDTDSLRRLLERYPRSGDPVATFTGSNEPARVIEGQEQRVVICNFARHPDQWESMFRDLMDVKREYPHITFHFNGQKSIPRTLATGVDSFDHPVTIDWIGDQPRLLLASGHILSFENYEKSEDHRKWARLVGIEAGSIFRTEDRVRKSRRMYTFNLRSLKWSFSNYEKVWSMRVVDETDVDPDEPDMTWVPVDLQYRPRSKEITDKWICDLCSISDRCPFSRPGAICIVDDTEAANLAGKFKTRNSRDIIDGMGTLLGAQVERAKRAMAAEDRHNDNHPEEARFSPEVTKMLATTFDQAAVLARLVDPTLNAKQKIGRKLIVNAGEVAGANPRQLAAGFVAELEAGGHDITNLTPAEAEEFLSRLVPSGTMPPDVDHDAPAYAPPENGDGRDPVASPAPSVRAAPRIHP